MKKINVFSLFRIARNTGKIMNDMNTNKTKNKRTGMRNETIGHTREMLDYKTFRHNQQYELCEWVNNNDVKVVAVTSDGSRMNLFYIKIILKE